MLSRVIIGVRTSVFATLSIISVITILGTILGVIAGYYQGKVDEIIMRVSDIFLAFPQLVFA